MSVPAGPWPVRPTACVVFLCACAERDAWCSVGESRLRPWEAVVFGAPHVESGLAFEGAAGSPVIPLLVKKDVSGEAGPARGEADNALHVY